MNMTEEIYLWLLIPYSVALVWVIGKFKFRSVPILILGFISSLAIWYFLYAIYNYALVEPDPALAFAPIEIIMKEEAPYKSYLRYFSTNFGWLVGLALFGVYWAIAWLIFKNNNAT
jgi:hypothetical protein